MTASSRSWPSQSAPRPQSRVPMNPMVDGWMGDDWFHTALSANKTCPTSTSRKPRARTKRNGGSGGLRTITTSICAQAPRELGRQARHGQLGFWKKILGASQLRLLVAAQRWTKSSPPTAQGSHNAGGQPLGPGRYLWRSRSLQSSQPKDTANDKVSSSSALGNPRRKLKTPAPSPLHFSSDTGSTSVRKFFAHSRALSDRRRPQSEVAPGQRL